MFLVVAAVGAMALPASAAAGSYTVYGCRGPGGEPIAANGWSGSHLGSSDASNECEAGGPLSARLLGSGPWQGGVGAEQRFTAPAGTRAISVRLYRRTAGLASPPPAGQSVGYYLRADQLLLESCEAGAPSQCGADLDGVVDRPGLDAAVVRFNAGCLAVFPDQCQSGGTSLRIDVSRVAVGLRDQAAPVVTNVGGSLPGATGSVHGTLSVTFDAGDDGGGVYRTLVAADGQPLGAQAVGSGACADADAANNDPYEFTSAVPCPLSQAGVSAALDTTQLSNGRHTVTVLVEDAAGNRTPVVQDLSIDVDNPPAGGGPAGSAPGGSVVLVGASPAGGGSPNQPSGLGVQGESAASVPGRLKVWFTANRRQRYTVRYGGGRRVVTRGRLVNRRGRGIFGARIDVYHRVGKGKLRRLIKTGLKTRRGGKLTLILPVNVTTREIVFAYRARRPGRITSRQTLRLKVVDKHGRPIYRRRAGKRRG